MGALQRTRDVDLRGDFPAGDVLQELGDGADDALVEPAREGLVAVLLGVVGLDVLEQGLDVPVEVADLGSTALLHVLKQRAHALSPARPSGCRTGENGAGFLVGVRVAGVGRHQDLRGH